MIDFPAILAACIAIAAIVGAIVAESPNQTHYTRALRRNRRATSRKVQ